MPTHPTRDLTACLLLVLLPAIQAYAEEPTFQDIKPILQARCVLCHRAPEPPLGLSLDSLEDLLKGSQNGPIVSSGAPSSSKLIKRLKGLSQPRMPMTGPPFLSKEEIALFERWIAGGLKPGTTEHSTGIDNTLSINPTAAVNYGHVEKILVRRCVKCHSPAGLMGGPPESYLLTSYTATLSHEDRARVVPGSADSSELVRRIRGQAIPRMPYDGPPFLDEAEITLIINWINQGARDARGKPAKFPAGAKVRLHGRLGSNWQLDSLPLKVNAATRLEHSPRTGDYVQVRGRLMSDGALTIERIRPRE
ncbi:c-type cytochrome domain-containing protein [Pseudomonas taeanensis]|jgi:uncharacterized membrane protein|uniref:c-type cytochrome domain-containing protein n=1 Tax=Pseudomonas taeanensis TaxID=574962 RepID=UPI0009F8926A|nr:c-type cytochrome domain-containing protein [Pseudomonas taeanensis]